jgi:hypothetical protein
MLLNAVFGLLLTATAVSAEKDAQGLGTLAQRLRDMEEQLRRGAVTRPDYDLRKNAIVRQIESSPEAVQQLGLDSAERRAIWETLSVHQKAAVCQLPQGVAPRCLDHILGVYSEVYSQLTAMGQDARKVFVALGPEHRLTLVFLSPEERRRYLMQQIQEVAARETERPQYSEHRRHVGEIREIMEGMIRTQQARVDECRRRAEQARRMVRESKERQAILEEEYREKIEEYRERRRRRGP